MSDLRMFYGFSYKSQVIFTYTFHFCVWYQICLYLDVRRITPNFHSRSNKDPGPCRNQGLLDWDAPSVSVWCELAKNRANWEQSPVQHLEKTLRTIFVLVSVWSVGLLLWTAAERSQEPTQGPVFVVPRDPCTFPMQGSPECIFLCDQGEGRVKHYWQGYLASFDAELIRGYKSPLSLAGRPPPARKPSPLRGARALLGNGSKSSTSRSRHAGGAVRLFCYFL